MCGHVSAWLSDADYLQVCSTLLEASNAAIAIPWAIVRPASPGSHTTLTIHRSAPSPFLASSEFCDILGHQNIRHHIRQCTCGRSQGVQHDYSASQHLLCCTRAPISVVNSLRQVLTLPPHQVSKMPKITKSSAMVHIPSAYIRAPLGKIGLACRAAMTDRPNTLTAFWSHPYHPCDWMEGVVRFVYAPITQRHPSSGAKEM